MLFFPVLSSRLEESDLAVKRIRCNVFFFVCLVGTKLGFLILDNIRYVIKDNNIS